MSFKLYTQRERQNRRIVARAHVGIRPTASEDQLSSPEHDQQQQQQQQSPVPADAANDGGPLFEFDGQQLFEGLGQHWDNAAAAGGPAGQQQEREQEQEQDHQQQQQPGFPAGAGATTVRFRILPESQRQPRSAAANKAAAERNWGGLHDPVPWLSSLQDRADLGRQLGEVMRHHILQQCKKVSCPGCGCSNNDFVASAKVLVVTHTAEVLVVTHTAVLGIQVPIMKCSRCPGSDTFNLHPFRAGCFPGTPVEAVRLLRNARAPPLWFRADLLQQLFLQRQFQQRMSVTSTAAALHQLFLSEDGWHPQLMQERFERSLRDALNNFAVLQVKCADPQQLGLAAEEVVCCDVCSGGHEGFLLQQQAIHLSADKFPVMGPAPPSDPSSTQQQQQQQQEEPEGQQVQQQGPEWQQQQEGPEGQQQQQQEGPEGQHQMQEPEGEQERPQQQPAHESSAGEVPEQLEDAPDPSTFAQQQKAALQSNPLPYTPRKRPLVILFAVLDGLLRLPRLAKAGLASKATEYVTDRIVPDRCTAAYAKFDPLANKYRRNRQPERTCHSFNADTTVGHTSEVYDINGIVSLLCRHGHALMVVNMPTGERFIYAQYLLHLLMSVHLVWPFISFYDINCKFGPHFRDLAHKCGSLGLWSPALVAWASLLNTPLPPFHKYMHSVMCAALHALELLSAAGLGCGEPTEVLNKFIGIAGTVLQYAAKAVRTAWLEVLLLAWRRKKESDLPDLLWRMWSKALVQQSRYLSEQLALWDKAAAQGVSEEELDTWAECPVQLETTAVAQQMPWQASMAELVLTVTALSAESDGAAAVDQVLPASLLTGSNAASNLAKRSRELRSLEDTHQVQQRWALGSCQLLDGVAQLCLHRVSSLQAALATCSSLYAYTLYLQEHMGPARKVHRSLDQQLSRQRTKMRGLIKQLLGWVCELQRTVQHLLPVGGVSSDSLRQQALASVGLQPGAASWATEPQTAQPQRGDADDAGDADDDADAGPATEQGSAAAAILQQLCDGQVPWEQLSGVDTLPLVRKRMGLTALKIRAAATEQELVVFEFDNLFRSYDARLRALSAVLDAKQRQRDECMQTLNTIQGVSGERQATLSAPEQAQVEAVSGQCRLLYGQCTVLKRQHAHLKRLQQRAQQLYVNVQAWSRLPGEQLPPGVLQAAAAAAQADMGGDDDAADGQRDICSEEEEWMGNAEQEGSAAVPEFGQHGGDNAAAQLDPAAAAAAGVGVAAAGPQPDNASSSGGSDVEVYQVVWGASPPWTASPQAVQLLEGLRARSETYSVNSLYQGEGAMHRFDLYELRHLAPGAELSMGVVNARVKQLNARTASFLEQGVGVPALLCLPTYFMAKLVPDLLGGTLHSTKSHAAAKHCIRPELLRRQYCSPWASVLDCGLVLVPCHVPSVPNAVAFGRGAPVVGHWILLVADLDQQQIFVIDPMQGDHSTFADALEDFLRREATSQLGAAPADARLNAIAHEAWVHTSALNTRMQEDAFNCGVFAMVFADCLSAGFPIHQCPLHADTLVAARAHLADALLEGLDEVKHVLLTGQHVAMEID